VNGSIRRITLSCIMGALLLWAWIVDTPKLNLFPMAVGLFLVVFLVALAVTGARERRPPT
jgi:hypothetical protein